MAIEIKGNWRLGFAFDVHTLDSVYLGVDEHGHNRFENTRSEMGQLVYELKYEGDQTVVQRIVDLLEKFKGIETRDYIIPIPPTNPRRRVQPVAEIARELGKRKGVSVLEDVLCKKPSGPQLKNVDDPDERRELLGQSLYLNDHPRIMGKTVLLLDDLYRSGATLSVATELLLDQGRAKDVCVLTMTKTRSRR